MAGTPFYNEKMVQHRADEVLARYAQHRSEPLALPISAERIAEDVFDLSILWEPIPEQHDQTILAGLAPDERLIVFNEKRRTLFEQTAYLYETVLAHEIGHWCLHVDQGALAHALLPGFDRPFQHVCKRGDGSWEERHAHWFASYLLLPRDLLSEAAPGNITRLGAMYRLRDRCRVTITVLQIALESTGRSYVDESGGVHRSKQEYLGQQRLF